MLTRFSKNARQFSKPRQRPRKGNKGASAQLSDQALSQFNYVFLFISERFFKTLFKIFAKVKIVMKSHLYKVKAAKFFYIFERKVLIFRRT
jgi:hypothetical protein